MKATLLLLVLPAFVLAKIYIDISPASESSDASVRYSGSVDWPITETDQVAFGMTDKAVYKNNSLLGINRPAIVMIRANPKYDHKGLTVTVKPTRAYIISNYEEPVVVALKEFSNHIPVATVYKGDVKEDVTEVMTTSWSAERQLDSGQNICARFGGGRIVLESAWRENSHHSTARPLSAESSLEMTLQPGQEIKAVLKATKASLKIQVEYEATLSGCFCNRHVWLVLIPETKCWDVEEYMEKYELPRVINATEIISLEYYYGPNIDIKQNIHNGSFPIY